MRTSSPPAQLKINAIIHAQSIGVGDGTAGWKTARQEVHISVPQHGECLNSSVSGADTPGY